MTKENARRLLLAKRRLLTPAQVARAAAAMCADIAGDPAFAAAKTVYLYDAVQNEIDPHGLLAAAWQQHKTVALPVVAGADLVFAEVTPATAYAVDGFGIREPVYAPDGIVTAPGLMIVPLVGFAGRYRLGRGKGYYDRYLATHRHGLLTIGVAYRFQKVRGLVFADTDVPLDQIRAY